jgi:hypothetical protein
VSDQDRTRAVTRLPKRDRLHARVAPRTTARHLLKGHSSHGAVSHRPAATRSSSPSVAARVRCGTPEGLRRPHRVAAGSPAGRTAWTRGHVSPTSGDNSVDRYAATRGRSAPDPWTTHPSAGDRARTTRRAADLSTARRNAPDSVRRPGPQFAAPSDLRRPWPSTLSTGPIPTSGDLFFEELQRRRGVDGGHGRGRSRAPHRRAPRDVTPGLGRLYGESAEPRTTGASAEWSGSLVRAWPPPPLRSGFSLSAPRVVTPSDLR